MIHRRHFLRGLFAAPAIIAIGRLMPVKALVGIGDGVQLMALAHPYLTDEYAWFDGQLSEAALESLILLTGTAFRRITAHPRALIITDLAQGAVRKP